jgi:site-specific recombinase XerD
LNHSANTLRIYRRALLAFNEWCAIYGAHHPVTDAQLARYLNHVLHKRGASVVPVHLSAIGRFYRARGWRLNPKAAQIAPVMQVARREGRA